MVSQRKPHVNKVYGKKAKVNSVTLDEIGRVVEVSSYVAAPITSVKSSSTDIAVKTTANSQTGEVEVTLSSVPSPGTIIERGFIKRVPIYGIYSIKTKIFYDVFSVACVQVTLEEADYNGPWSMFFSRNSYVDGGLRYGQIDVRIYGNAITSSINYMVVA